MVHAYSVTFSRASDNSHRQASTTVESMIGSTARSHSLKACEGGGPAWSPLHIVREFYQIFGKSGNKFPTKKFLHQCLLRCLQACVKRFNSNSPRGTREKYLHFEANVFSMVTQVYQK